MFTDPSRYTDASQPPNFSGRTSEFVLQELGRHIERLADRYVAPGQHLMLEVLDIDLAGRREPLSMPSQDTRYLQATTWPQIKVRYRLQEGGIVLAQADEIIVDRTYLQRPAARASNDPLRFEKIMLDDWFRQRFGPPRSSSG